MWIGYFSNLNLTKYSNLDKIVNKYVEVSKAKGLDILICAGGISNNCLITKDFVTRLGNALKLENIIFRFIVGNTDFYYGRDFYIDKEAKFKETLRDYRLIEYYLPTHNIQLKGKIRITGLETWYDYSLYRGKECDLKKITKKSFMGIKNKDVVYITNESDYSLGIQDTFDVRFSNECLGLMDSRLSRYTSSYGLAYRNIAVMYFSPVKFMLGDNTFNRYMGTFKGSLKYLEPLLKNKVDECIIGCKCKNRFIKYKNISMVSTNKVVYVDNIILEDEVNA